MVKHDPNPDQFSRQLEAVQAQIERLIQLVKASDPQQTSLYDQLLEGIRVTFEELHVADEELHQQNEQLVSAQQELEAQKRRYQDLFELAPDGYLVTDRAGIILEANQAAGNLLNNHPDSLIRKPLANFILLQDRKVFRHTINQLIGSAAQPLNRVSNWEIRMMPYRGQPVYVSITVANTKEIQDPSDKDIRLRWSLRDISKRKQIEKELNELRHKLVKAGERERQKLARALHDGPIQDLYGISFLLKTIDQDQIQGPLQDNIPRAQGQLEEVAGKLRAICGELRPQTLMPFGLQKAITSHGRTFQADHPELSVHLNLMPDGLSLSEDVRLALFRIYQHAMSNVLRHSKAGQVWVNFDMTGNEIRLEIQDDGIGFDVPESWIDLVRDRHYGLADATERAESIGGQLEVTSKLNDGTLVRVRMEQEGV